MHEVCLQHDPATEELLTAVNLTVSVDVLLKDTRPRHVVKTMTPHHCVTNVRTSRTDPCPRRDTCTVTGGSFSQANVESIVIYERLRISRAVRWLTSPNALSPRSLIKR